MGPIGSRAILATLLTGVIAGIGATLFHLVADRFGAWLFAWGESTTALTRLPFVLIIPRSACSSSASCCIRSPAREPAAYAMCWLPSIATVAVYRWCEC
jgi:hypothetical protein